MTAMLNIIAGRRPARPDISNEVWLLVEECWKTDATQRPCVWDVYNRLAVME